MSETTPPERSGELASDDASPDPIQSHAPARARNPKVLLIDGEPMLRALTSRLLERQGAEVTVAVLPCDVSMLARAAFDVVVIDLDAPGASRVMSRLAESEHAPRRMVTCTGRELTAAENEACTTVLRKPFDFAALAVAVLGRALRHRQRRRGRATPARHTLRTRRRAARGRLDRAPRSSGDRNR